MAIEQACLLKGWLIAKEAPEEVMDAVEVLISHHRPRNGLPEQPNETPPALLEGYHHQHTSVPEPEQTPKKTRTAWSDERKAKQAEVMRATQARLKREKQSPGEAQAPSMAGA